MLERPLLVERSDTLLRSDSEANPFSAGWVAFCPVRIFLRLVPAIASKLLVTDESAGTILKYRNQPNPIYSFCRVQALRVDLNSSMQLQSTVVSSTANFL